MSKNKKLIPELRFPEFEKNETWAERKLSDVLFEHKEKSTGKEEVYSVSVHKGVVNQIEHLGRVFAASNTSNYKKVLPGDIIYTKSPTGDFPFGIIKQSKVSTPVIVSPLYGVFRPETNDIGIILDAYFEYPERTINYLSSIIQKGAKNTINIHNDTFLSKSLILPVDKKEQQKIASCISSLEEMITAHSQKLDLLKSHKKGLMQNLFPQEGEKVPRYRFKEFENDGEWKKKPVKQLFSIFQGYAFASNDNVTSGTRWIKIADVGIQEMKNDTQSFLPMEFKEKYKKFLVKKGDYVLALTRPILNMKLKIARIDEAFNDSLLNQRVGKIVTSNDSSFVYYLLQTTKMIENINKNIAGNEPPNLSFQQIEDIEVFLPSKMIEQQKIASCLSALDELITSQTEQIEQLKQHKKGLMQGLFPKMND
ncbi:type I restriction enzyme S subunit [Sphingobacterium alimentarium]|uniref:Type I restriction enzyme S subunit n=1 Tax=Sphingobacterium alimentarium TaxID=797292 RepID=A0A4R3W1R5_9SPHI|nr:restriction endonuclease subunit S [Sphingobacterium alimentarium]TCV20789.1 type I restriction enzyme S subunit [Sphingobacterium alimentarium]